MRSVFRRISVRTCAVALSCVVPAHMAASFLQDQPRTIACDPMSSFRIPRKFLIRRNPAANFDDDYEILEKLGEGGFATIFLVRHKPTDLLRVAKVVRLESQADVDIFRNEVSVMTELDSPYMGRLVSYYVDEKPLASPGGDAGQAILITHYIRGPDLLDGINERISQKRTFSPEEAASIALHMLRSLAYLHQKGFIHRDIKPENFILIDNQNDQRLKLIDFGLVSRVGSADALVEMAGTSFYMAPETFASRARRRQYSDKSDCWSAGVILVTVASGGSSVIGRSTSMGVSPRSMADSNKYLAKEVAKLQDRGIHPSYLSVVKKLLVIDPSQRLSAQEALDQLGGIRNRFTADADSASVQQILTRARDFAKLPELARLVRLMIAHETGDSEFENIDTLFQLMDTRCRGVLSESELTRVTFPPMSSDLEIGNLYTGKPEIPFSLFLAHNIDRAHNKLVRYIFGELSRGADRIKVGSLMLRDPFTRDVAESMIRSCNVGTSGLEEGLTLQQFERCVFSSPS